MQKFGRLSSQFHHLCYNNLILFFIEKEHVDNFANIEYLKSDNESEI